MRIGSPHEEIRARMGRRAISFFCTSPTVDHMASGRERDSQRTRVVISDRSVCHHCHRTGLTVDEAFCPDCGFPQGGTEKQQYAFIVKKRRIRSEIKDNENMLGYSRYMLWVAALVNGVAFGGQDGVLLGGGLLVSLTFVGLSFWVKRNAFAALLTAFIVYVSLQLFLALFDPIFVLRGLMFKILIGGSFSYGMFAAKRIERLKKQL